MATQYDNFECTITNALIVAAEQYERDARTALQSGGGEGLRDQFLGQARAARELAGLIERDGLLLVAQDSPRPVVTQPTR